MQDNRSIETLNNIVISRTADGFPIHLDQVATVRLDHVADDYYSYVNGKPAISLSISAKTGSDVPSVHKKVVTEMKKLEETLPEGYTLDLLYAENDLLDEMFGDLSKELIIAMIAVIIVCMMGLNLITSTIVMLAIPLSIAIGLLFLPIFDVTLNQMTVIGIIIVLSLFGG